MRKNSRLVRGGKSLLAKEITNGLRFLFSGEGQQEKLPRIFVTIPLIIHHFRNRSVLHLHNVNNFIIHGSL